LRGPGIAAILAIASASALLACGGSPQAPPADRAAFEPHWQDVFETMPELLVVVHAKAARDDRVYGPLLRRALDLARDRSAAVAATRVLDAMSEAEELVMGVRPDTPDAPGETVLVARGVRADVDPGKLVDADGTGLWAPGPSGRVRELVRERDEHGHPVGASLFELPGRTWVIAQGDARARARSVFAHPVDRPRIDLAPQAIAMIRIDGPSLVRRVRALQDLGGLAAVGHHLLSVTFVLPPGAERSLRATFAYQGDDDAAVAEVSAREAVHQAAGAGNKPAWLPWLGAARVERGPKTVALVAPLPPQLVEGLLHAGSAPLEGDLPSPR
jgi:hypothetical protein